MNKEFCQFLQPQIYEIFFYVVHVKIKKLLNFLYDFIFFVICGFSLVQNSFLISNFATWKKYKL